MILSSSPLLTFLHSLHSLGEAPFSCTYLLTYILWYLQSNHRHHGHARGHSFPHCCHFRYRRQPFCNPSVSHHHFLAIFSEPSIYSWPTLGMPSTDGIAFDCRSRTKYPPYTPESLPQIRFPCSRTQLPWLILSKILCWEVNDGRTIWTAEGHIQCHVQCQVAWASTWMGMQIQPSSLSQLHLVHLPTLVPILVDILMLTVLPRTCIPLRDSPHPTPSATKPATPRDPGLRGQTLNPMRSTQFPAVVSHLSLSIASSSASIRHYAFRSLRYQAVHWDLPPQGRLWYVLTPILSLPNLFWFNVGWGSLGRSPGAFHPLTHICQYSCPHQA